MIRSRVGGAFFCALAALACAAFAAQAAKPDPAIYPSPNVYRDPALRADPQAGFAKLVREFCPGEGRGLIHFLEVDGRNIRIRRTWPTYLELSPGSHRLSMEFKGPATSIWATWEGVGEVSAELEAGKVYLVRYRRTAKDAFRVWLEPLADMPFEAVGVSTSVCDQSPFPDPSLHQ